MGASFNDAVPDAVLEKVHMSIAGQVGHTIVGCGVRARLWKFDMQDAYKNAPV